jgi:hypothetical protein
MEQDDMLVPGQVDVALHTIGAICKCLEVGGAGMFREGVAGTAVREHLGPAVSELLALRAGDWLVDCHDQTLAHPDPVTAIRWAHAGEL